MPGLRRGIRWRSRGAAAVIRCRNLRGGGLQQYALFGGGGVGDAGFVVGVDGREGAELKAVDVGEDGSAARRDVVGGEKFVEIAERVVDALGGLKALMVGEKRGLMIEAVGFVEFLGVGKAKRSARGGDGEPATAA